MHATVTSALSYYVDKLTPPAPGAAVREAGAQASRPYAHFQRLRCFSIALRTSAAAPAPPPEAAVDMLTPALDTATLGTPSLVDSALPPLSAGPAGPATAAEEDTTAPAEAETLEALHELELQRTCRHVD